MDLFLYILAPTIVAVLFMFLNKTKIGSDHAIHISVIDRIKENKHRFLTSYIFSLNDKYAWYPQLFHWFLSFLPSKIYKERYIYINVVVKFIEVISFNLFIYFLYERISFDKIVFLYANVVINAFPFNYAAWNAKNNGVSPRGLGLVAGQIYSYLIVAYIISGNQLLLLPLFVTVFLILIMSLMAMQYVLLTLPFFSLFFKIPEIITLPFLAYALSYLLMPRVTISCLIGQFNHKRNYALYSAGPFILKNRPSIYRDFVYDFWVKLKKNFKGGVVYIYTNPLVEIIYGLPFLWFVVFFAFKVGFDNEMEVMFYTIIASGIAFFLTSFSLTRFLGEPQRYLEFVIPIITILYVLNFGILLHSVLVLGSVFFVFLSSSILNRRQKLNQKEISRNLVIDYLTIESIYSDKIFICNDNEIMKFMAGIGIKVVRPDYSLYIKSEEEFYKNYCNQSLYILSPDALQDYYNKFSPQYLLLNTNFYDKIFLLESFTSSDITLVKTIDFFELYEFKIQK